MWKANKNEKKIAAIDIKLVFDQINKNILFFFITQIRMIVEIWNFQQIFTISYYIIF